MQSRSEHSNNDDDDDAQEEEGEGNTDGWRDGLFLSCR